MTEIKLIGEAQVVTQEHIDFALQCFDKGLAAIPTIKELRTKFGFGLRDAKVVHDTALDRRYPGYIAEKNAMIEDMITEFAKDPEGL